MKKMPNQIEVDRELCKGCLICLEYCPRHVLVKSAKPTKKGFFIPVPENTIHCNVCRRCELYCPDFAIAVIEQESD